MCNSHLPVAKFLHCQDKSKTIILMPFSYRDGPALCFIFITEILPIHIAFNTCPCRFPPWESYKL